MIMTMKLLYIVGPRDWSFDNNWCIASQLWCCKSVTCWYSLSAYLL